MGAGRPGKIGRGHLSATTPQERLPEFQRRTGPAARSVRVRRLGCGGAFASCEAGRGAPRLAPLGDPDKGENPSTLHTAIK